MEENMKGMDKVMYMWWRRDWGGRVRIRVRLEWGRDGDMGEVEVEKKVEVGMGLVGEEVEEEGVRVEK